MTFIKQTEIGFSDAISDPFARGRFSTVFSIFDAKQLHDKDPDLFDEAITDGIGGNPVGTATSVHTVSGASTVMTVNAANDYVIRQTFSRFNYSPGKGQLLILTGNMLGHDANVNKKIGYFNTFTSSASASDYDGIYYESDGSELFAVIKKFGFTTASVPQSGWNLDTLDGSKDENNPSGINLDITKSQIFIIDFEWLGVGRVRFGFYFNGKPVYVHEYVHNNSEEGVYMSTPNHSVRYEISSSGGTGSLEHICCSVESEGGFEPRGFIKSYNSGSTDGDAFDVNDQISRPCVGFRLKDTHLDSTILFKNISIICSSAVDFRWEIYINPEISLAAGESFDYADVDATSALQVARHLEAGGVIGSTVSGGSLLASGYSTNNDSVVSVSLDNIRTLGCAIDGTRDTIVICLSQTDDTGGEDFFIAANWQEVI